MLGDDRYGAELEKVVPGLEAGIFGVCIEELDGIAAGFRADAGRYQRADQSSAMGG
ncbi:hypothetical protein OHA77_12320 [Streptosporangium sp. NBC_01639]|uniref:hypothetical protein n=1 Tax=Streptosporangium sp. NBC_01639 TaxID=2975948 RepID=UPI00386EE3F5|nr:hypothetical protein OHA77_12320 [Streptosporangium sp. NBC_01639]